MPRFAPQIVRQKTGQVYDLVLEAPCPRCGWELCDRDYIDRIPSLDGWDRTARARCENCGCVYHVRFDLQEDGSQLGSIGPPTASWFGSTRRR